ncbi:MAG: TrbG/VirB9 family P-type conjugative transfer protein [Pseudomonadales bacterium]|nr:TrbG/VirB9 family P-type conjugative transfer protein [Pseudomonadales bacterium]
MNKPLIPLLFLLLGIATAQAAQSPIEGVADARSKVLTYQKGQVYSVTAHTGISTTIEFAEGEVYTDHQAGFLAGWDFVPTGRFLTLKPKIKHGDTNVTIFTNRRQYLFALKARDPNGYGVDDKRLNYYLEFNYPEDETKRAVERHARTIKRLALECEEETRFFDPTELSFHYYFSGDKHIAPIVAFDNGQFTYLKIAKHAPVPSVYAVDRERNEGVVNVRMEGDYIVIEQVLSNFTLRHGNDVVSVTKNNARELVAESKAKKASDGADYSPW